MCFNVWRRRWAVVVAELIRVRYLRDCLAECAQGANIVFVVGECAPCRLIALAGGVDPGVGVGAGGAVCAPECAGCGGELFQAVAGGTVEVGPDDVIEDVGAELADVLGRWTEDAV